MATRATQVRLISEARLRELSASGWLMSFLEQYPIVRQLQAGAEDECLRGAVDVHVHAGPCSLIQRTQDFTQVANGEMLVEGGKVRPELERIIEPARDHGIGINLGAPGHSEKYAGMDDYEGLAPVVERIGVLGAAAVLDHPLSSFTVEQIAGLVGDRVYASLFCYPSLPSVIKAPVVDPARTIELVERVGPERCIIASDVGMLLEPTQLDALRLMIRLLMILGLTVREIDPMLKANPARLIGLDRARGA